MSQESQAIEISCQGLQIYGNNPFRTKFMKSLFAILLVCSFASAKASDSISCLPNDVTQDTLVSGAGSAQKIVTVREALGRIGARCEGGKLVDKTGKEVCFVHLLGCWGNPPQNY